MRKLFASGFFSAFVVQSFESGVSESAVERAVCEAAEDFSRACILRDLGRMLLYIQKSFSVQLGS